MGHGDRTDGPIAIKNGQAEWAHEKLWNTATDFYFEAHYQNGVKLIVSSRVRSGVTFEGSDGLVWVNRGAIEASPSSVLDYEPGPNEVRLYRSDNHQRNFIDCVISRFGVTPPDWLASTTWALPALDIVTIDVHGDPGTGQRNSLHP